MLNDKEITKEIIEALNSAIDIYNNNFSDIEPSEYNDNREEFKFLTDKFYDQTMEAAYLNLLNIGYGKFSSLTEKIINLYPEILENIDIFYILRYRYIRNRTSHGSIKITEQNPFPRLFFNAKNFILKYIDEKAIINEWKIPESDFYYDTFTQVFNKKLKNNERIRILVVGPMHDFGQILSVLGRFYFNIILDFDPYSRKSGLGLYYSQNYPHNYIDLYNYDIIKTKPVFSRNRVEIVMCDGDENKTTESFEWGNKYLPSQVDEEFGNSWTKLKNTKNPDIRGKLSISLLSDFFKDYFQVINKDVDLLFLMDYSEQTTQKIIDTIGTAVSPSNLNTIFIDETKSAALLNQCRYENWHVYNTTICNFLRKIEENTSPPKELSHEYFIPSLQNYTGKIGFENYYAITTRYFFLLHQYFHSDPSIEEDDTVEYMFEFSRGQDIKWKLVTSGKLSLEKFDAAYSHIKKHIKNINNQKSNLIELLHIAGFGGSTVAKHAAYKLSQDYPVLFMKSFDKDSIASAIEIIHEASGNTAVIFVEQNIAGGNLENIRNAARATGKPHLIVYIRRAPSAYIQRNDEFFVKSYIDRDIEKIIAFNREALINHSEITDRNDLLSYGANDFKKELGENNVSPFTINLSIFLKKFVKLEDYVGDNLPNVRENTDYQKIFEYICIFSIYTKKNLSCSFIQKVLNDKNLSKFTEKFDALVYKFEDEEIQTDVLAIRHYEIAVLLLSKLHGREQGEISHRQLSENVVALINDVYGRCRIDSFEVKTLRDILIPNSETRSKTGFTPIVDFLWDERDITFAGNVLDTFAEKYSDDAFISSHTSKYYYDKAKDFSKAYSYAEKAKLPLRLGDDKYTSYDKTRIYHAAGMCAAADLEATINNLSKYGIREKSEIDELFKTVDKAAAEFTMAKAFTNPDDPKTIEYVHTKWLTVFMDVFTLLESRKEYKEYKDMKKANDYRSTAHMLINILESLYLNHEDDFVDENGISKYRPLMTKKQNLDNYEADESVRLNNWDNFYDKNKRDGLFENCLYSCNQRFYIIESMTKNFTVIDNNNQRRIERIAKEFEESLDKSDAGAVSMECLNNYMIIAAHAGIKTDSVSSTVSQLCHLGDNPPVMMLFSRYIIRFLQAYEGDNIALMDTPKDIIECSKKSANYRTKTPDYKNHIFAVFQKGKGMGRIINKLHLRKKKPELKGLFNYQELETVSGILNYRDKSNSIIIPYDVNGKRMDGIDIHVNLSQNAFINKDNDSKKVTFKFGFSLSGIHADGMSVRPAEEAGKEKKEAEVEQISETADIPENKQSDISGSDSYISFKPGKADKYKKGAIKGVSIIHGKTGDGKKCRMLIDDIQSHFKTPDKNKLYERLENYYQYCCKSKEAIVKIKKEEYDHYKVLPDIRNSEVAEIIGIAQEK